MSATAQLKQAQLIGLSLIRLNVKLWFGVWGLVALALLGGCVRPLPKSGASYYRGTGQPKQDKEASSSSIQLNQSGDAKEPSSANQTSQSTSVPVPAGSIVEVKPDGTTSIKTSAPTELRQERVETQLSTSTPNAPPTISEQKDAEADFWTVVGLRAAVAAGVGLFIVGLVRDWDLVAIGGGALAVAGLVGLFIQKHPTLFILVGAAAALCVVGPLIWKFKIKPLVDKQ